MAAPNIILNKGQILLKESASSLDIDISATSFMFGDVEAVYEFTDRHEVGDVVMFNPKDADQISYSNEVYFLTTEDKIFFTEIPPV